MQLEENRTNFDRNLAVVIGINRYSSNGIHDLKTAVDDAIAIADLLEIEYAYKKTDIIRLLDGEATLIGLKNLLSDTIPNQLKPTDSDRLIFYYAGHGIPRNSKDGPAGYLVPQDADLNNADSFLPMQYVYEQLSQLACHHLLVILDCCFAGTFQWAGSRKLIPILETVRREHYDRFIRFPAWQVITSSAHDQEAMDVALDNVVLAEDKRGTVTNSSHSPFALALIEGLQDNRADLIPDGVVTAHELYLYLEQRVSELSKQRQNPGLYPLRREYDRGEFIFTKPGFTRDQLKPAPPLDENNNPYRGLKSFDEKHAGFFFGRQALIEELAKRLLVPNQPLAVVLGVSGSGKSSLVKAGLIPYLRDKQAKQWYILEPMRPGELPFTSLARVLLPVVNANLLEQLSQVSFLDEALKRVLEFKTEADQDLGRADQAKPESDRLFQMNETLIKVAQSWCSATPEARLLLVEDYLAQLEILCRPEEQQLLVRFHDEILARLDSLLGHLQQDPQYLIAAIKTWSQNHPNIKLLLVIDQFEELITASHEGQTDSWGSDETGSDRTTEPKQWQPFLLMLRGAIPACPEEWRVVLTLRSDFEPRFLDSPLKSYWKDARFPVRAMNSDELRDAIEGPALKQALYFEPPELVGKLIDEVGQMPGALPLLSFTLSELYIKLCDRWTKDNASDRALRIKDYEELGGVAGALTRRATQEYDNLVKESGEVLGKAYQATMRRVMLRMVTIEGGGVARRRVPESELIYPDAEENKRVAQVSDRLVKARLLVKGQESGEPYVEPVHDFLVRGWDQLQIWTKEEQENLVLQRLLTPATKAWRDNNCNVNDLWDNNSRLSRLREIRELGQLQKTYSTAQGIEDSWLNQLEEKFVERSIRRRKNRIFRFVTSVVAVILSLGGLTAFAFIQSIDAQIQALTTSSELLLASNQELDALIAALKAAKILKWQLPIKTDTRTQAIAALQQVVYRIKEINRFQGSLGNVTWVHFSPDSKTLVSNGNDGKVRLWSIGGKEIKIIRDFGIYPIWNLDISKDGKTIALAHSDKVELQSIESKQLQTLTNTERVEDVSFGKGDKILAVTGSKTVQLWNVIDGKPFQTFPCGGRYCSGATISQDGKMIAIGGHDGGGLNPTVRLWSLNGRQISTLSGTSKIVFSPNSKIFAFSDKDGTVKLQNLNKKLLQSIFAKHKGASGLCFSPDGTNIAIANGDGIEIWSIAGKKLYQIDGHGGTVMSLDFSSDSKTLSSASADGTVRLWSLDNKKILRLLGHSGKIQSMAFSLDGKTLSSGSENGVITLWSLVDNKEIETINAHDNGVNSLSFTPNSKILVSASYDSTVKFWKLDGKNIKTITRRNGGLVNSISLDSKGQFFVTGIDTESGVVELWDFSGQQLKTIGEHLYPVNTVSFSADNEIIGSGDHNGTVKVWNLDGKEIQTFTEARNSIYSLTFSPDGKILAYAINKAIKLHNLNDKSTATLTGHSGSVNTVRFSSDGKAIASGSEDGKVKIWGLNGRELQTLVGHNSSVNSVAFSPSSKTLASADDDGLIILWNLDVDKLFAHGCNWAHNYLNSNPNLTNEERSLCN